jgi:hypothetical protein
MEHVVYISGKSGEKTFIRKFSKKFTSKVGHEKAMLFKYEMATWIRDLSIKSEYRSCKLAGSSVDVTTSTFLKPIATFVIEG